LEGGEEEEGDVGALDDCVTRLSADDAATPSNNNNNKKERRLILYFAL